MSRPRFIDRYKVILMDMGNTFMFGCDRFHDTAEIAATYAREGGVLLADGRIARIIAEMEARGLNYGRDPARWERFPSMSEVLAEVPSAAGLPPDELERIVRVFGFEERGTIPAEYVETLRTLRRTHRMGLVSNVWAPSSFFRESLDEAGVSELLDVIVFSSDYGILKPSPLVFEKALAAFDARRDSIVYAGDSYRRDVAGARAAGIGSIWITKDAALPEGATCAPDLVVRDLGDLLTV